MSEDGDFGDGELDDFNARVGTSSVSASASRGAYPEQPMDEEVDPSEKKTGKESMWAKQGISYFPCDEAVPQLGPGQYEILSSQSSGIYFKLANGKFDELIALPDSASEAVIYEIEKFWTKEEHFRSFGFMWKRGILLWGPPGSGKTCCLQQVSCNIIEQGGIAVYASHPGVTAAGLGILRRIEPERPIVVMMEDLDAMVQQYGEQEILALLDGELQIDNVVFIATTNYPERLDKRIVNRPSRFDLVKLIDMPNANARKVYLTTKNKRLATARTNCPVCYGAGSKSEMATPAVAATEAVAASPAIYKDVPCIPCEGEGSTLEVDAWVDKTDRFSIAHLKELIVSVEVFEVELDFALKRLNQMLDRPPKSSDTVRQTGQYT
jgi:SpoVK/Ycf46/Vps4 family AAA+-type ATPase